MKEAGYKLWETGSVRLLLSFKIWSAIWGFSV